MGMEIEAGGAAMVTAQSKPFSNLQDALQPSPSRTLPSSHSSSGNFTPSPQSAVHLPPAQVGSTSQVGEQPSYGCVLPSSHCSLPSFTPSPHVVATQAAPGAGHLKPVSKVQSVEQPSPAVVLPSSQSSSPAT